MSGHTTKTSWPLHSVAELLQRVRRPVDVKLEETYQEIGIRSHCKGIFHKPSTTGKRIGDKRVFWVEPGCLVLNIVFAWEHAVAMSTDSEAGMIASHRFPMYASRNGKLTPEYAWRYFSSPRGKYDLGIASPGGAGRNKTLGQGEFNQLRIPVPPLSYQRMAIEALNTADRAIEATADLIAARQDLKKGLAQELLSGKHRNTRNSAPLRSARLRDIATIRRGASPRPIGDSKWFAESGPGWVRIADVTKSKPFLRSTRQKLSAEGTAKSVQVDHGDLIMSICATIGVPRIVDMPACIHDGFVVLRDYERSVNRWFLYHYLEFFADRLAYGGQEGTQRNINTGIVGNVYVPLPPRDEQERIAAALGAADRQLDLLEAKLAALGSLKKGLTQKLLAEPAPAPAG